MSRTFNWTPEKVKMLKKLASEKMGNEEIAEKLGCNSRFVVSGKLKKLGIKKERAPKKVASTKAVTAPKKVRAPKKASASKVSPAPPKVKAPKRVAALKVAPVLKAPSAPKRVTVPKRVQAPKRVPVLKLVPTSKSAPAPKALSRKDEFAQKAEKLLKCAYDRENAEHRMVMLNLIATETGRNTVLTAQYSGTPLIYVESIFKRLDDYGLWPANENESPIKTAEDFALFTDLCQKAWHSKK